MSNKYSTLTIHIFCLFKIDIDQGIDLSKYLSHVLVQNIAQLKTIKKLFIIYFIDHHTTIPIYFNFTNLNIIFFFL